MGDRLEKFIKAHRVELDDKHPRKDLWKDIELQINSDVKERSISNRMVYWRAAAVILLLISSWLVFDKINQSSEERSEQTIVQSNPELLEAETYYTSLIDQKRQEINNVSQKYNIDENFLEEIDKLDSMYIVLKQNLNQGNEENMVDAMILNLQFRIDILNKQLSIIESIENSQKDETIRL